jgi:hypothetical protein
MDNKQMFKKTEQLQPYVKEEHRELVETAYKLVDEHEKYLMDKIQKEFLNNRPSTEPSLDIVQKAEKFFYDDPVRIALYENLAKIKLIYETPRFIIKQ